MLIELDYKGASYDLSLALARALSVEVADVEVAVCPPLDKIPLRCDWRVVKSCADMVAYVRGEMLQLNIV